MSEHEHKTAMYERLDDLTPGFDDPDHVIYDRLIQALHDSSGDFRTLPENEREEILRILLGAAANIRSGLAWGEWEGGGARNR